MPAGLRFRVAPQWWTYSGDMDDELRDVLDAILVELKKISAELVESNRFLDEIMSNTAETASHTA